MFLTKLYSIGIQSTDVGIISPYIQQVRTIRSMIDDSEMMLPKIGTIEEFQGQERQIIIVSTVRSNQALHSFDNKYGLGFITSTKRMNVAISRAR